jgi:hypothetical protein
MIKLSVKKTKNDQIDLKARLITKKIRIKIVIKIMLINF